MNILKYKKGYIALSISLWIFVVLTTVMTLESQWLAAYMDAAMYKRELAYAQYVSFECLDIGRMLYDKANITEDFVIHRDTMTCFGKTGDMLWATTTSRRVWYATSTKF